VFVSYVAGVRNPADIALLCLLGVGVAAAAWSIPHLPPRLTPWAPLDIHEAPVPAVTALKMAHLQRDHAYCEAALATSDFRRVSVPLLTSFRGCAVHDAVRISSRMPAFNNGFTASCPLSVGLAMFIRYVVQPAAARHLHSEIVRVDHLGTFSCRPIVGGRDHAAMSEHAAANAIDIIGFVTRDGRKITVTKNWNGEDESATFLHEVRDGACPYFKAVLSPDFNAAHRTHFHLDMGRFKVCR